MKKNFNLMKKKKKRRPVATNKNVRSSQGREVVNLDIRVYGPLQNQGSALGSTKKMSIQGGKKWNEKEGEKNELLKGTAAAGGEPRPV